ncbi:hypothetical protein [Syntrophorhabdus aromaticivorans]|uniref:hypothetical protein n=1 Tax=Syntrophorhabdus aromaticivorans TaxID=328301 RepID=UPI0003F61AF3|nr:hypothetical protein [Syntrophorhabdus aromaticivorans]HBA54678.1 hypothetical protein [Syntrophorhabdus aromaticivorans]
MNHERKIGIICIFIGICVPLIALPFVSGYSKGKGFMYNFLNVGITINTEGQSAPANHPPVTPAKQNRKTITYKAFIPKQIPFRWFLAVTAIFFYIGIIRIERSRHAGTQDKSTTGPPGNTDLSSLT